MRPNVSINLTNNNLGRLVEPEDGIALLVGTGIAVAGSFALGDVLGPVYQRKDAEALGITEAYDAANSLLLWHQIKSFYATAGDGAPLYIMPVAASVTLTEMADKTQAYAASAIASLKGKIRIVMLTRVGAVAVVNGNGMDDDVLTAVVNAQALWADAFSKFRPASFLIEGRGFSGTAGNLIDLRDSATSPNANRVGVVLNADPTVAALDAAYADYADVGLAGGRMAAIPVQRNIGRVRDGALPVTNMGLSNGANLSTFSDIDLVAIHDKGYIFAWEHIGKAGYFFNMDNAACVITDDYAYMSRGRTIDKAARLLRVVYLEDLLDELEIKDDGTLEVSVVKHFQSAGKSSIEANMIAKKEASSVSVFVDPKQNVLSTDQLKAQLKIVPVGIAKEIVVELGFDNPANA